MHHNHHGVLGSLGPIGVVAAPGPGGPVGIGIGVPIMTPSQMHLHHHQQKFVSPDSSDDKDKCLSQIFSHSSSPPCSIQSSMASSANGNNPCTLTWANPLLQSVSGMGYPVMGMNVMGPTPPSMLSDPNMLYGLITNAANGPLEMNLPHSNMNVTPPSSEINPQQINSTSVVSSGMGSVTQPQNSSSTAQPAKEIIHCKSCTLFPPNPSAPLPTTREKPPGCRTVFVGGLPENVNDEIIREIFDRCGEIITIRMSKKNFCHIRYELEYSVDTAIFLSGYRIRIGSNSDATNIGRLHVDYAQARDDLYEWECRQRQSLREQRHRERIEQERLMPASPPPIAHYSDHEASIIAENIKSDDAFIKGIHVLVAWLDRGDCIKRNSSSFYSMIQSTNSHIRRLLNEKSQYEDELQKAREIMRQRLTGLLMQFGQIEKVFISACHKKAWDHFSKAQRKNLEMWRKQATEIKNVLLEEALAERNDEEMDFSESESESEKLDCDNRSPPGKKARMDSSRTAFHQLKEENDALRCQLEASNNEVDLMKADLRSEMENKDLKLKILQQELMELQRSVTSEVPLNDDRCCEKSCSSTTLNMPPSYDENNKIFRNTSSICDSSNVNMPQVQINHFNSGANNDNLNRGNNGAIEITEKEARLIGVISTFLHVHPFGASLDYIWSYTEKVLPNVRPNQLESLLTKFPTIFRQEVSGIGASLERKWVFTGFS